MATETHQISDVAVRVAEALVCEFCDPWYDGGVSSDWFDQTDCARCGELAAFHHIAHPHVRFPTYQCPFCAGFLDGN